MKETEKKQSIQNSYDVVVVGAGNGGLTSAAELSRHGVKVLLLEQHNVPGGFATSFVRGRFEFEASLHELNSWGPENDKGGVRHLLEEKYGIDAKFVPVPEAYRVIITESDEYIDTCMPFGIDNFIDAIEEEVPGSKESLQNFFKLAQEFVDAFNYIGKAHGNPDQKVLLKEYPNFLRTAAYPAQDVEDALNIPKKAQDIMNAYWCYLGLPISRINSTIFAMMLHSYLSRGAYIPKKRSHEYTTALDKMIRESGGKIEYNTKVDKILVENGKVVGVETSNGDKISTKYVISNASPTLTYNELISPISEVPEIAYKEINARIHGLSAFVVYLGLDKSAEELGIREYSYFIMATGDTEEIYDSWTKLQTPKGQATVCLNNALPDCSPPGTSILYITTLFRPEVWYDIDPKDYFTIKNKIAKGLIDQFEEATGSKISDNIEEIEVAAPPTFARYTKSYNGIVYGYELEPWDSVLTRFMCREDENHIEGLEFAGGFSRRGHGYSSSLASGQTAALFTLSNLKKGGN
jgi:phytoene dehydrogenase-like protein